MKSSKERRCAPRVAYLLTHSFPVAVTPVFSTHGHPHLLVWWVHLQYECGPVKANCNAQTTVVFNHHASHWCDAQQKPQRVCVWWFLHLIAVSFLFSMWAVPDTVTPLRAAQTLPISTWSSQLTLIGHGKYSERYHSLPRSSSHWDLLMKVQII